MYSILKRGFDMSCCDGSCAGSCGESCGESCGGSCGENCGENCGCENCCQDCGSDCGGVCGEGCCSSFCDCSQWNCCGTTSGIPILKINTLTSFTVMMLSLVSGIIGILEQVPISITFLSIGLILTAFTIFGLMIFPRISRSE